jgi:hypothetical protein
MKWRILEPGMGFSNSKCIGLRHYALSSKKDLGLGVHAKPHFSEGIDINACPKKTCLSLW